MRRLNELSKKRTLAGFSEVADSNDNVNINNNDNNEDLETLLGMGKEKPKLTGIYFDLDVLQALDKVSSGKKGMKTKLVNEAVKRFLKQGGYME
jgi:hypothetical protein